MQIEKDGLHVYEIYLYTENDYYFSMECPMINYNHPPSIIPIEIREEDGEKKILFDITGKTKIEDYYKKRQIGYEECYNFIKGMLVLFRDLEEYMLSEEQVSFCKDDIYIDSKGAILWKYTPKPKKEIGKEIEGLFLWILGHLDYRDQKGINFMHRIFHGISKQEFSKDYLQEKLEEEEKEKELPNFLPETEIRSESEQEKDQKHGNRIFELFADLLSIICALLFFYGVWLIRLKGMNSTVIVFLAGNLILGLGMQMRRIVRKAPESLERFIGENRKRETKPKLRTAPETIENPNNIFERLEEEWGRGDETVLLSDLSNQRYPTLTRKEGGKTVTIQVFPFYIGSEKGLNQMPLHSRTVSRQHAVIVRGVQEDTYYIEDLASTNGTFVNGRRIEENQETLLHNGSSISFADDAWIFHYQ